MPLAMLCAFFISVAAFAAGPHRVDPQVLKAREWQQRVPTLAERLHAQGWRAKREHILPVGWRALSHPGQFHSEAMVLRYRGDWSGWPETKSHPGLGAVVQRQCQTLPPPVVHTFDAKNQTAACWTWTPPATGAKDRSQTHTFLFFRSFLPGVSAFVGEVVQLKLDAPRNGKPSSAARSIASTLGLP